MSDRFRNQEGLINPDKLAKTKFLIVGCGAIGSFYAMTLAKMGAKYVTVMDHDKIEEHNLTNQMFPTYMTNKFKVDALAEVCEMFGDAKPHTIKGDFDASTSSRIDLASFDVIVSCVDNMDVRKTIYEAIKGRTTGLFVEGRMGAQVFRAYAVKLGNKAEHEYYEKEWYPQSEATPDRCTQKSIIYTVLQVSGVMLSMTKRYLTGKETVPVEVIYDCLNDTLQKKILTYVGVETIDATDSTSEPDLVEA